MKSEHSPIRKSRQVYLFGIALSATTILLVACAYFLIPQLRHGIPKANIEPNPLVLEIQELSIKKETTAIAGAKARLDLATQKSDLDAMFIAIKELQALGDDSPELVERLPNIQLAIPLLQQIRLFQSDHNHEEVVKTTGQFLVFFPEHPEARRVLKESGLIFAYLDKAINSLKACFEKDNDGRVKLISKAGHEFGDKQDLIRIAFHLNIAEKSLEEAIKLDPQFEHALSMEKVVTDTKNALGYLFSSSLISSDKQLVDNYFSTFSSTYSTMIKIVTETSFSATVAWEGLGPILEKFDQTNERIFEETDELSWFLGQFKGAGTTESMQIAREIHLNTVQLRNLIVHPSGSMLDYRNSVVTKHRELVDLSQKMSSSMPNPIEFRENSFRFSEAIDSYELFKNPSETKPVLEKYKALISA